MIAFLYAKTSQESRAELSNHSDLQKMEMSLIALAAITLVYILFLFKFLIKKNHGSRNLPDGSLGLPLIGETISYLRANKKDQAIQWIDERVAKYGPVFKTSLLGTPVVFMVGLAGNKFLLGFGEDVFATERPKRIADLQGENNIFELSGSR